MKINDKMVTKMFIKYILVELLLQFNYRLYKIFHGCNNFSFASYEMFIRVKEYKIFIILLIYDCNRYFNKICNISGMRIFYVIIEVLMVMCVTLSEFILIESIIILKWSNHNKL